MHAVGGKASDGLRHELVLHRAGPHREGATMENPTSSYLGSSPARRRSVDDEVAHSMKAHNLHASAARIPGARGGHVSSTAFNRPAPSPSSHAEGGRGIPASAEIASGLALGLGLGLGVGLGLGLIGPRGPNF